MGFTKREVLDNLVILGNDEGNVQKAGGIMTRLVLNTQFDKPKTDYEFVDKNGELKVIGGGATLARQIGPDDVGKFFKMEFEGWGRSANGKFKKIAVYIWDGEPSETMKAWPRFQEFYGKSAAVPLTANAQKAAAGAKQRDDFEDMPEALDKDDDDLPF
jgi:hypothetical protein